MKGFKKNELRTHQDELFYDDLRLPKVSLDLFICFLKKIDKLSLEKSNRNLGYECCEASEFLVLFIKHLATPGVRNSKVLFERVLRSVI